MLRTCLSVVAVATLSLAACTKSNQGSHTAAVASDSASPAASLCDALPAIDQLTLNKAACVTIASKHSAADAGTVKDICEHMGSIYSPGWAADDDDSGHVTCFDNLIRKAKTPVLTLDLAAKLCEKFPQPDAGITADSLADDCKEAAKTAVKSSPSAGQFLADQCNGVRSMFDQVAAVTYCYGQGAAVLAN